VLSLLPALGVVCKDEVVTVVPVYNFCSQPVSLFDDPVLDCSVFLIRYYFAALSITLAAGEARRTVAELPSVRRTLQLQLGGLRRAGLGRVLLPVACFELGNVSRPPGKGLDRFAFSDRPADSWK
jgi:hypothetical protein